MQHQPNIAANHIRHLLKPQHTLRRITIGIAAAVIATGCTTRTGPTDNRDELTGARLEDAALTPLEDLNLRRTPIPKQLKAMKTPYGPTPASCATIMQEVLSLNAILGADRDHAASSKDNESLEDIASQEANKFALDTVESTATSFIPFRSLVRRATGATAHEKALRDAYEKGLQRRAYIKGVGQALDCEPPASPYPLQSDEDRVEYRGTQPNR